MKRFFVTVLALFFMAATSNLVLADEAGTSTGKTVKSHKKHKHHKKPAKVETTTNAGDTTAPPAK